jgi:hypothetical protein
MSNHFDRVGQNVKAKEAMTEEQRAASEKRKAILDGMLDARNYLFAIHGKNYDFYELLKKGFIEVRNIGKAASGQNDTYTVKVYVPPMEGAGEAGGAQQGQKELAIEFRVEYPVLTQPRAWFGHVESGVKMAFNGESIDEQKPAMPDNPQALYHKGMLELLQKIIEAANV